MKCKPDRPFAAWLFRVAFSARTFSTDVRENPAASIADIRPLYISLLGSRRIHTEAEGSHVSP